MKPIFLQKDSPRAPLTNQVLYCNGYYIILQPLLWEDVFKFVVDFLNTNKVSTSINKVFPIH